MKFPGGRLLHTWDLARQRVAFDDLLRSCRDVNLTGFAEIKVPSGAGMLLCYLGSVVSLVYRDGPLGYQGSEAGDMLRRAPAENAEGSILVYELPMEMAHLLRGLTGRHRAEGSLRTPAELSALVEIMKGQSHTGLVEVQPHAGAAALMFVNGRLSNIYWDAGDGRTLEQGPAFVALQRALDGDEAPVFVSRFSQEVWRGRHEPLEPPVVAAGAPLEYEQALRRAVLADLDGQIPAMKEAIVFDLLTGAILERRIRGSSAFGSMLLTDKIPALAVHCRDLIASAREDDVEAFELTTLTLLTIVAVVGPIQEGVAVVTDRSQPRSHVAAPLSRVAATYGEQRRVRAPAAHADAVAFHQGSQEAS